MRKQSHLSLCALLALAACSPSDRPPDLAEVRGTPPPGLPQKRAPGQPIDACLLLYPNEIQSVQGEPVQSARPSRRTAGNALVSECHFTSPARRDSVILTVTQSANEDDTEIRQQWNDLFDANRQASESDDPDDTSGPRFIPGLGEAGYWVDGPDGGALHVLHDNLRFRLKVDVPGETNVKIDKAEALAEMILKRL